MTFYLFKFLLFISRPWTLILLGVGVTLRLLFKNRTEKAKLLLSVVFAVMWVLSLPVVSHTLLSRLENRFAPISIAEIQNSEAIVVLGGTASPVVPPRIFTEEPGGERLSAAARLFINHKATLILVSGGVPYRSPTGESRTESTDMKDYLLSFGIPPTQIIEENQSRNTEENIRFTTQILQSKKITEFILVTSAFHMTRTMNYLSRFKFNVTPFPTEIHQNATFSLWDFIPSVDALSNSTLALKEYLGSLKIALSNN